MTPRSISICILVSLGLVPSGFPSGLKAQEVVDDYSWAKEQHAACADQLLGSHEEVVGRPFSTTAVATVRALADACGERQVSLVAKTSDRLQVHVAQVMGEPIVEQLLGLQDANPANHARNVCTNIAVEHALIEGAQAEKFRPFIEELGKRDFSLLPAQMAIVHGAVYSVWVTSGQWTGHISFTDIRDPIKRNRLARWAEEVLAGADLRCDSELPRPDETE